MIAAHQAAGFFCRIVTDGSHVRLGLMACVAVVIAACTTTSPVKERSDNRNPVLLPLAAQVNGQWVRMAAAGSTVEVRAHASDPDGDKLRYRWVADRGGGTVQQISASIVRWTVGRGRTDNQLHLIVADGKGGFAKETLRLPSRPEVVFAGRVVSVDGKPVAGADVDVNGQSTTTGRDGRFRLPIEKVNAARFVLNIRKWGYGLVSRIYDQSIHDGRWVMAPATVTTIDPSRANAVVDTQSASQCTGSLTSGINWANYPIQRIPRMIDTFGQLTGGAIPNDITQALNVIFGGTGCSPGISISLPPNVLVDGNGNPPRGNVEVALTTVDLYAPFAMPGDYSVQADKESVDWMQSWGAGTVEIRAGNTPYQLKQGATAELTIPVDPTQAKVGRKNPPTIPWLIYDEGQGRWRPKGVATLNGSGTAYVAKIDHLSAFNSDLIKTDQSCIRFRGDSLVSTGGTAGQFDLDVIIPMANQAPVVRHWQISPSSDPAHATDPNLHVVANLPNNTWVTFIPMRNDGGNLVPYGIFGINSGPPQTPTDPNIPPFPYVACQNQITLTDVSGAAEVVKNGAGVNTGPLPTLFYALTEPTGQDIYPLNPVSGAFALYGLYDTGSTKVRINNALPNRITGNNQTTDRVFLNVPTTPASSVNVRLNGLNTRAANCGIPIGAPGSANPPQIQVSGIATLPYSVDATLIGAPVVNQTVAFIDYTQIVNLDAGCDGVAVSGPFMDFFEAGEAGIPAADVTLSLERFGNTVSTDGATAGQRYWLRNVVLQDGNNVAADDPGATDPIDFMFDTGTTLTIVNDRIAGLLGLTPNGGTFNCFGGTSNGYVIDSVNVLGGDGSYRVENASVCWQQSAIQSPQVVDAVIGSNFFTQVKIVIDGVNNTLGIIE